MRLRLDNVRALLPDGLWTDETWSVTCDGDRIADLGPRPSGSADLVVDAHGRALFPGLADAHTHITIDEQDSVSPRRYYLKGELVGVLDAATRGARAVAAGITTFRDCNAPGRGTFALREVFNAGRMPGPRLFLSGQAICATGGHMHAISFEADGADAVRRGVREQIKAGADFIKLVAEASSSGGAFEHSSVQLTVAEMSSGVDAAHRMGRRATAHAVSRFGVGAALEAGVDSIEHGYDLTDELVSKMVAAGTWLVPTLSVHDSIARLGRAAGFSSERIQHSEDLRAMGLDAVRRAHRAGVRIACGSDAGSPLNPVWDLVPELQLLVAAGFSSTEALIAATRETAELLGTDAMGVIEQGAWADLVVVDGDPEEEVGAVANVVFVSKAGEILRNALSAN